MKLKTKFQDEDFELGEVADVDITTMPDGCFKANAKAMRGGLHTFYYDTKGDFDNDWEDVPEEPKKGWYLDSIGRPTKMVFGDDDFRQSLEAINNYFETEEEAKKTVKKLKAWKRLKDKGFAFKSFYTEYGDIVIRSGSDMSSSVEMWTDLVTCFGGEE